MGLWNKLSKSFLKNIKQKWMGGISSLFLKETLEESFWENLEETLLLGDVGVGVVEEIIEDLRDTAKRKGFTQAAQLQEEFANTLLSFFKEVPETGVGIHVSDSPEKPSAILLVGINGSGKTTTAGKLAFMLQKNGNTPILAACDTFRAAAIDQLKIWGERMDARVIAQPYGSDPAAVLFDALQASKASGKHSPVIADTAGRLHNKQNLMAELGKIHRVAFREADFVESLLVLDTMTGQNGLRQAEAFCDCVPLTGVVLTKFDNTAKGGIILSIARELKLPVRYLGFGEKLEDLELFSPEAFVESLLQEKKNHVV
ncbi:MAG TPA: signal recognition particle-docking protein FtsY [Synergistaceae bacterium]|nr:signal recognition particle-docking protein FtsY [Synergistaceae bacterium]HPJ24597.1 signal recognition particle-docking protein FtsY [Synergistaceae bacterium]HPQ36208.1 signal recognition particle-docking protein FtsY [Synergistaceae bacterium]